MKKCLAVLLALMMPLASQAAADCQKDQVIKFSLSESSLKNAELVMVPPGGGEKWAGPFNVPWTWEYDSITKNCNSFGLQVQYPDPTNPMRRTAVLGYVHVDPTKGGSGNVSININSCLKQDSRSADYVIDSVSSVVGVSVTKGTCPS